MGATVAPIWRSGDMSDTTESDQPQDASQGDLFEEVQGGRADASWFHIFRQMFDNGDVKDMGSSAFTVYCAIKFHVNFQTGVAFPSIDRLVDFTGISERQVKRDLATLEKKGYLTKSKVGRNNQYTLREKVRVVSPEGRPIAEATWDYLPSAVKEATAELRNYIHTGEVGSVVHIERLVIQNLNVIKAESGSTVNIENYGSDGVDAALKLIEEAERRKGRGN